MSWVKNNEWLNPDADQRIRWNQLATFLENFRPFRRDLMVAGGVALLSSSGVLLIPWIFRVIQEAVVSREIDTLGFALVGFLTVLLLEVAAACWIRIIRSRISTRLSRELVLQYYRKILNLAVEEFIAFRQRSNLFQRLIDAMAITDQFTAMLIRGGRSVIVILIVGIVIGVVSPVVLGVLTVGTLALFAYVVARSRRLLALRSRALAINYPLVSKMIEIINGLFTIKALAASVQVTSDIVQLADAKREADYREQLEDVRASQGAQAIRSVTLVLAVATGFALMMTNRLLVADVVSLYVLSNLLLQPVSELADYYTALSRLSANIEKYHEVLSLQEEADETAAALAARKTVAVPGLVGAESGGETVQPRRRPVPRVYATVASPNRMQEAAATNGRATGAVAAARRGGRIAIHDLEFAYRGRDPVLSGINLEIEPGEKISVIGRSGVGKTTLMRLLLGFLQPQRGTITVDGMDVGILQDKNGYRRQFGVVGQQDVFFDVSIRDNLRFGLGEEISDDEIAEALKMVNLWSDIEQTEKGLETTYSGDLFSGGQKQRLFIARALLRKPSIVILDEPTSALDFESEEQVMHAIDRLVGENTTLTIAHRLSTVQKSDRVVLLDDRCVKASGTHAELHRTNAYYRALCEYNSFML